jgi:PAS domain S-box-containing protein
MNPINESPLSDFPLGEAEEMQRAIRSGQVDAFVVPTPNGDQVFTLSGADRAYRVLVEGMGEGAATVSTEGDILYANRHLAGILRKSLSRVIGSPARDLVIPEDRPALEALLQGTQALTASAELSIEASDGTVIPVKASATRLELYASTVTCLVLVDVTRSRKAAAALAASEKLFHSAMDTLHDALMILVARRDPGGRIVDLDHRYANAAALRLYGRPAEAVIGQGILGMFGSEADGRLMATCSTVMERGQVATLEVVWTGTDPPRMLELESSRFEDGLILTARDVTESRHAEAELARRARELGRTNLALERSNEELEQFAYIASHDLAEPLRTVSGPIGLLARRYKGRLDGEADRLIDFALGGCLRMQDMINDLLAFSRVGRLEGPPTEVDCNAVIDKVLAAVAPLVAERGATVDRDDLPAVQAEPGQLERVFQNLISNALKFTSDDRVPVIHIAAERQAEGWRLSVTDNAIGIEPRHRERVWVMFKRLHTQSEYPGTGIGLAMVKKIVERHGGTVGIDSATPGPGSVFWFTFPEYQNGSP